MKSRPGRVSRPALRKTSLFLPESSTIFLLRILLLVLILEIIDANCIQNGNKSKSTNRNSKNNERSYENTKKRTIETVANGLILGAQEMAIAECKPPSVIYDKQLARTPKADL